MNIRIALAGNPNCGKTTLFNALTGSNQYVGNWPGVTVEKKEGSVKKYEGVTVTDLPGIYSLSPYTMEEVVARNYLVDERPDAILNIVDGTNLERNLYLTTQLCELGIPVVIAINMMDVVEKTGSRIDTDGLGRALGCRVVKISALKSTGIIEAAEAAIEAAKEKKPIRLRHPFSGSVEHAIAHIEEACIHDMPEEQQRWYAVKIFERDKRVIEKLALSEDTRAHIERDIVRVEEEYDDDAESIITNERYVYICKMLEGIYYNKLKGKLTTSDKIDRIVTGRALGLPIFAVIMFLVYFISMVGVGRFATDWMNDGVFGDGFHLVGIGDSDYEDHAEAISVIRGAAAYAENDAVLDAFGADAGSYDPAAAVSAVKAFSDSIRLSDEFTYIVVDEETKAQDEITCTGREVKDAAKLFIKNEGKPDDPAAFGIWIPGIPALAEKGLAAADAPEWLSSLILDGIIAGVGAVLGFVPQMLVLFLLLAFLEACGYMARIAFVLDRVFRRFGLSGKSFIPILIGTGCGVPGIMASRTIENERDRRMTIITTTFIPCGAKVPFISMIAGAIFGGSPWVSTSAYFIGMAAIILSGVMLKKTRMFAGEGSPFVMELPAYHMPTLKNVLRAMWERGWEFIKKAGTIILLSTIVLWFLSRFGWVDGTFRILGEEEIGSSILAAIGSAISWLFAPLGWGAWEPAVASFTGLIAKENIVSSLGVLYSGSGLSTYEALQLVFTGFSAYSFLVFNLLCAPCFAAIGAIRREMNSAKWTWFAIGYQCAFAYAVSLIIYQFGSVFSGNIHIAGFIISLLLLAGILFLLLRPNKDTTRLKQH